MEDSAKYCSKITDIYSGFSKPVPSSTTVSTQTQEKEATLQKHLKMKYQTRLFRGFFDYPPPMDPPCLGLATGSRKEQIMA
ncbi:hypothetical protein TNCV_4116471 [Trichonephila clavipes]|nr:hypothetical protein TNCV_4116471 [Trichonephila clavipes]